MKRFSRASLLATVVAGLAAVAATTPAAAADSTYYLSDLAWKSATNGWGPVERDRSNGETGSRDGHTITLNGVTYTKGLGVHASSEVVYGLGAACSGFQTDVGVDDEMSSTKGSVVFQVFADGAKLYDSGLMKGSSPTKTVSLSTAGVNDLRLVVTDGGNGKYYDHADWADAQVTCSAMPGTVLDTTSPSVAATAPTAGATGVAGTTAVTARFSEAVNSSSVNGGSFFLVPQGSTTPVPATVTYDAATLTARLTPASPLASGATYVATVKGGSTGVKDAAGNQLAADRTWNFGTAAAANDTTAPSVAATSPLSGATGVAVTTVVTARFSEAVNSSTVNGGSFFLVPQGSTTSVPATVTYDAATLTARLTPASPLASGATYVATVKGGSTGVKDAAGNQLAADRTWNFGTTATTGGTASLPAGSPKYPLQGWSDPIPAGATVHPNSAQFVTGLMSHGQFGITLNSYTVAVYESSSTDARINSVMQASWSKGRVLTNVPYSSRYTPSSGSDHHIVVLDGDCQYEFWGWSPIPTPGQAVALDRGVGWTTEIGVNQGNASALGGLVFPDELEAAAKAKTSLPHALAFAAPVEVRGFWVVAPARATGSDTTETAGRMPMGARLRLDPSFNVETLNVDEYEKVILRTLQRYGAFLRDGGGFDFYGADTRSFGGISYAKGGTRWTNGIVNFSREAAKHLQVLQWGPPVQTRSGMRNGPDTCADSPVR